jgi:hypothetical protein
MRLKPYVISIHQLSFLVELGRTLVDLIPIVAIAHRVGLAKGMLDGEPRVLVDEHVLTKKV